MMAAYLRVLVLRLLRRGLWFLPILLFGPGACFAILMKHDHATRVAELEGYIARARPGADLAGLTAALAAAPRELAGDLQAVGGNAALAGVALLIAVLCEVVNEERRRGILRDLAVAGFSGASSTAALYALCAGAVAAIALVAAVAPTAMAAWTGAGPAGVLLAAVQGALLLLGAVPVAIAAGVVLSRSSALMVTSLGVIGFFVVGLEAQHSVMFAVSVGLFVAGGLALPALWSRGLRSVG